MAVPLVWFAFSGFFDMNKINDRCHGTGLGLSDSLKYSLRTCLVLNDNKWLLAAIDIDNLKDINKNAWYSDANIRIGTVIRNFCDENPMQTKGFRNSSITGKNDSFAVLIRYNTKLENAQSTIETLIKRINNVTNQTISVGVAKK